LSALNPLFAERRGVSRDGLHGWPTGSIRDVTFRHPFSDNPARSMTTKLILICDDDPLLVELLEFRLGARGFDTASAADGEQALERATALRPDAIVLDAMMPVHDGYEVLRRLREDPDLRATPVVMLTARRQERDIVSALELGASEYMVKPFIPEELVTRLARLLERGA
jgi:DNA-binding response OmpR family regulator